MDPQLCFGVFKKPLLAILVWATAFFVVVVAFDMLPWLRGPSEGQWRWVHEPKPWSRPIGFAIPCAAGLIALMALSGCAFAARNSKGFAQLMLLAALPLGFGFQLGLLKTEGERPAATLVRRTADNFFTSYFTVAAMPMAEDPREFLDQHAEFLGENNLYFLHAVTHPPGGVLFFRAAIAACENIPALGNFWRARVEAAGVSPAEFKQPLTATQLAGGLFAACLILFMGVASCVPVAAIARHLSDDALASARVGILWTLVPANAIMGPQLDQVLTLLVAAFCIAMAGSSLVSAILAGVLAGLALQTSYGSLALLPVAGLAGWLISDRMKLGIKRSLPTFGIVMSFALSFNLAPMIFGHEPWAAFRHSMSNHHAIIGRRDYATWLIFNPLDFAVFLGTPISMLFVERAFCAAKQWKVRESNPSDRFALAAFGGVLLLTLTGVARGEVGRIWMPLMPISLVAALSPQVSSQAAEPSKSNAIQPREAVILGALLVACACVIRLKWRVP